MQKVYVIMSYWYGYSDDSSYGDTAKVERIVNGTRERAREVEKEIAAELAGKHSFCYTDVIDSEMCE